MLDQNTGIKLGGEVDQLRAENASLTEEVTEQARLLGISAEKELTLLSKIEKLERGLAAIIKERNAFQDQCIRLEQKRALEKFELAEVKQDAERYRWLRHGDNDEPLLKFSFDARCNSDDVWLLRNDELDAAIDAEMKGK